MAVSTMKFMIMVSTIMALFGGINCQTTAVSPGFQDTNSLLQNVTNTSATNSADGMASVLPEIILLLQNQWTKENEYRNNTIEVLQRQLEAQQYNHDETKTSLDNQHRTLNQIADTQSQMADTFSQVVTLLQNMTSTMNSVVSVLENQQADVQNISHSLLPIVLDQQATEIELLNQQLMSMKNCCLQNVVNDYEGHVTTAEMSTEEAVMSSDKAAMTPDNRPGPATMKISATSKSFTTAEQLGITESSTTTDFSMTTKPGPTTMKMAARTESFTTAEQFGSTVSSTTAGFLVTNEPGPTKMKMVATTESFTTAEELGTTESFTTTGLSVTTEPAPTCTQDDFFCPDGTCVSKVWACDGFEDCADE
ncbi:uncharacterized protein [Amphiura filiformis]|uniref:uncharacterized protein n=1 Tax=Amphiura filiformis TaxID=82378 RepID=UPI003B2173E1